MVCNKRKQHVDLDKHQPSEAEKIRAIKQALLYENRNLQKGYGTIIVN